MSETSPYDFLTIKSKSEAEQLEVLKIFAAEDRKPSVTVRLRELAEEKFPLDQDLTAADLARLWGLAIWMSDIGTVLTKSRRKIYLERLNETIESFKADRRAIVSMSSQADQAISILNGSIS